MDAVVNRPQSAPTHVKRPLTRQLVSGFGASIVVVGATTLGVNYRLIEADLERKIEQQAISLTHSVEFVSEGLIEIEYTSILQRVVQNYATLPNVVEIAVIDPQGILLAYSAESPRDRSLSAVRPELQDIVDRAFTTGDIVREKIALDDRPVLVETLPFSSVLFGASGRRGMAIAILDLRPVQQEARTTFLKSSLTLMVGVFGISILMGLLVRQTILVHLQHLERAINHSHVTGRFNCPQPLPPNEIGVLAVALDAAFRALRESEEREKARSSELQNTLDDLQKTQAQLIQTEKMSGLGQMVAGIAHEINNPVSFIHGNLIHLDDYLKDLMELIDLYQETFPKATPDIRQFTEDIDLPFLQEDLPRMISSMQVGTQRIREIILSLRNFSRLDESEMKEADLHEGLDNTLLVLNNRLKEKPGCRAIQVIRQYRTLPLVECYPGQLNQVFMNVLSNATDVLEPYTKASDLSEPPTLWIQTESLVEVPTKPCVRVIIRDNGPGMTEAVRSKLFDPFFTTKPIGKGTGLGLSISYQIVVDRHHGQIECRSEPGRGTTFEITIPTQHSREG
ncbi:MAG: sensor histidine kinase [Cyanobacteria bacterium SBC]|nr:sensor histidine kinase [Cyanobacteria bacterium SBC]